MAPETFSKLFCAVLQSLIRQRPYTHRKPLWRFVLTCFRRVAAILVYPSSEVLDPLFYEGNLLDAELPGNYSYQDLWVSGLEYCTFLVDDSLIHAWNIEDIVLSLKTGFRRAFLPQLRQLSIFDDETINDREMNFIRLFAVRHRSNMFEKYRYIDNLFEV